MKTLPTALLAALLAGSPAAQEREPVPPARARAERIRELRTEIARLQAELAELMRAEGEERAGKDPTPPPTPEERIASLAEPWVQAASQVEDPARREQALTEVRGALAGGDPTAQRAALRALARLGDVSFDKAPLRPAILALARAGDEATRVDALYALHATAPEPEDVQLVLQLTSTPTPLVRERGLHLLALFSGGRIEGEVGRAALGLLATDDPRTLRQGLSGLWGARFGPEVEARLLALARGPEPARHDALYYALSTSPEKSSAVTSLLIERAQGADGEMAQRAFWGLGFGVAAEDMARVAALDLALYAARTSERTRVDCLRQLARYAGAAEVPELERIAAQEGLPASVHGAALEALRASRDRAAAPPAGG